MRVPRFAMRAFSSPPFVTEASATPLSATVSVLRTLHPSAIQHPCHELSPVRKDMGRMLTALCVHDGLRDAV